MAVGITLFFESLKVADYEKMHDMVVDAGTPEGLLVHTAGKVENGWQIFDIWESAEKFEAFTKNVLMPKMAETGFSKPHVTIVPLHNIWTPGIAKLTKLGENARAVAKV